MRSGATTSLLPALLLFAITVTGANKPEAVRLTISVDGLRNSRGVVGVLLFTSDHGWPEHVDAAVRAKAVPAQSGVTNVTFEGLQPGQYAAVVLHDENKNKKLDKNLFGVPREGWGMSNNPQAHAAAPEFDRARFVLRRKTRLQIHLNY